MPVRADPWLSPLWLLPRNDESARLDTAFFWASAPSFWSMQTLRTKCSLVHSEAVDCLLAVYTGLFRIQRTVRLSQKVLVHVWKESYSWKSGPFVNWFVWRGRQNLANRIEKVLHPPCAASDSPSPQSETWSRSSVGHWTLHVLGKWIGPCLTTPSCIARSHKCLAWLWNFFTFYRVAL